MSHLYTAAYHPLFQLRIFQALDYVWIQYVRMKRNEVLIKNQTFPKSQRIVASGNFSKPGQTRLDPVIVEAGLEEYHESTKPEEGQCYIWFSNVFWFIRTILNTEIQDLSSTSTDVRLHLCKEKRLELCFYHFMRFSISMIWLLIPFVLYLNDLDCGDKKPKWEKE